MDAFGKHIIQNINYQMMMYDSATGIYSPCNIDQTYTTQK